MTSSDNQETRSRQEAPDLAIVLNVIRCEIETHLLPELSSDHARTVAAQIDTALRYLIVRERPPAAANEHPTLKEDDLAQRVRADLAKRPTMAPVSDAACVAAIDAEQAAAQAVLAAENELAPPLGDPDLLERLDIGADRLTAYLRNHLPGRKQLKVTHIEKILGGFSKDTFFIDIASSAGEEHLALRRDNPYGPVDSSVINEFPLLAGLHCHGVAVPRPLLVERDPAVFCYPFIITEKLRGASQQATAGITVDASHIEAAKGLAEVMASYHRVDPRDLGLPRDIFDPALTTTDYLRRYLDRYDAVWHRTRMRESPTITAAFEWLRRNIPDSATPPRLVHGDAGLHNLLMHEGRPTAMLDWELAHFGDPTEDLVYCRLWIDSVMPWDEFLEHYRRHGGLEYAEEKATYYATQAKLLHCTFGIKAMRGFMETPCPALNLLYPKLKMTRIFQQLLQPTITGKST